MRKRRVVRAFSRAASTYDRAAAVQRQVADTLCDFVVAEPPGKRILEIGCGTGLLSERLLVRLPKREWILTDISPEMLARCRERIGERDEVSYRVMDGERPTLGEGTVDAIVSSLAMQWFDDAEAALSRLRRCLAPGGRLVFSTVGEETFHEWRSALHRAGGPRRSSPFVSARELARHATILGEARIPARFAGGGAFLRSLADLGATVPARGQEPLPPGLLRRAIASFEGVATYHILYAELRALAASERSEAVA